MLNTNWFKNFFRKPFLKEIQHLYPNWNQARAVLRMNGYKQRDKDEEYESEYITITIELGLDDTQLVEFWTKLGTQEEADKTLKVINKILTTPALETDEKGIQDFIRKAKNNLRNA